MQLYFAMFIFYKIFENPYPALIFTKQAGLMLTKLVNYLNIHYYAKKNLYEIPSDQKKKKKKNLHKLLVWDTWYPQNESTNLRPGKIFQELATRNSNELKRKHKKNFMKIVLKYTKYKIYWHTALWVFHCLIICMWPMPSEDLSHISFYLESYRQLLSSFLVP